MNENKPIKMNDFIADFLLVFKKKNYLFEQSFSHHSLFFSTIFNKVDKVGNFFFFNSIMMVSKLPVECLANIFENLSHENLGVKNYSFTVLHSCVLVNKNWCITAIPILWRHPWNWLIDGFYLDRLPLLAATFVSCL